MIRRLVSVMVIAVLATATSVVASTVSLGTLTSFTGGEAGEGLDLTGNIVYAFNPGGTAQTVQGVNFTNASNRASPPTGITPKGLKRARQTCPSYFGCADLASLSRSLSTKIPTTIPTRIWGRRRHSRLHHLRVPQRSALA